MMLGFSAADPVCSSNRFYEGKLCANEHDTVELWCSVNYSGSWAPVMQWQLNTETGVIADIQNVTVPYTSVLYTLALTAHRRMNGMTFSCITYFSVANKPTNTTATNVPEYKFTWTSPIFHVQCEYTLYHCNIR